MAVIASSSGDSALESDGKRDKLLQFKWRRLIVVCASLFIFAISTVASSLLLYFVFCPGSTPAPTPAPTTTTRPSTMVFDSDLISSENSRLISRGEWFAQPPQEPLLKLATPVPYVIITHSATDFCKTQSECTFLVRFAQTFHIESRNWSDIAYNFLVGGDGFAYAGRGWDYVGAATFGYNTKSISISFIGTFNSVAPPPHQLQAAQNLIEHGVRMGKIARDYSLLGHRQLSRTLSPGDKLYEIIRTWPHWSPHP